jgi:predicted dehydrogenase
VRWHSVRVRSPHFLRSCHPCLQNNSLGFIVTDTLRIAVIGAGYWGPNLVRNFRASPHWQLAAICDIDADRATRLAGADPSVRVTTSVEALLADDDVDAVAIATPAGTHHDIAHAALAAGKHVLVEKPLADTGERGLSMVRAAAHSDLVLMTDHTYCYTPAVLKMRELIHGGELGDILFIDSVRINLGLVQPDVDVFWDLAPHDLSIIDFILPGGLTPLTVSALGADPLGAGKSCIGYLTLPLANGAIAHVHVNWLSPTKIRQMIVGGSRQTLVWDDLNPQQRLSVYDRGVDLGLQTLDGADKRTATVSYRLGDTWSPALPETEALAAMVAEFAAAIHDGRAARTDGGAGLRVLGILEAASRSLDARGEMIPLHAEREPALAGKSSRA